MKWSWRWSGTTRTRLRGVWGRACTGKFTRASKDSPRKKSLSRKSIWPSSPTTSTSKMPYSHKFTFSKGSTTPTSSNSRMCSVQKTVSTSSPSSARTATSRKPSNAKELNNSKLSKSWGRFWAASPNWSDRKSFIATSNLPIYSSAMECTRLVILALPNTLIILALKCLNRVWVVPSIWLHKFYKGRTTPQSATYGLWG